MTSQIAVKPKRSTACYDLRPETIEIVRKLSAQLDVPAGDIVEWCVRSAFSKIDPVRVLTDYLMPTMKPGRYAFRLKAIR